MLELQNYVRLMLWQQPQRGCRVFSLFPSPLVQREERNGHLLDSTDRQKSVKCGASASDVESFYFCK